MSNRVLFALAVTFAASGVWDTIAGALYLFAIGTARAIDNPPAHHFYTVFLASFFFCFAYLQFMSALNIRRYAFNIGCLLIGRVFYVVQLIVYMSFVPNFPATFRFTGIIDGLLCILYVVLALGGGLTTRDLFLPAQSPVGNPTLSDAAGQSPLD